MLNFFYYLNSIRPLSEEVQGALLNVLRQKDLRKGQVWLQEGAISDKIAFIARGMTKLYFETQTKELIVLFAKEDEIMMSVNSFILQTPSSFSIRAVEPCTIMYIFLKDFNDILNRHVELNFHFRMIYQRQLQVFEKHLTLLFLNPRDRYETIGKYFPWMADGQRLTDRLLAAYLGITPNGLCNFKNSSAVKSQVCAQPVIYSPK